MLSEAFPSGGWLGITRTTVWEFFILHMWSLVSEPTSLVYRVVDLAPQQLLGDALLMK